jgi:hypothetical protein
MFHNFPLSRFSTLSRDGAYLIKSVPRNKLDALNDTPATCNTVANPFELQVTETRGQLGVMEECGMPTR